jgi:ribonuclease HI
MAEQRIITDFFSMGPELVCFTDGSTPKNGSKNAKGGYAVVWPEHPSYDCSGSLVDTTNNRCEYEGVIKAFEQAEVIDPENIKTLVIYTDSMLIVNSMTKWIVKWKKNNYKKADGSQVLNVDLIKKVDDYMTTRKSIFRHTKAHTKSSSWEAINNDKADKLAREAASFI